MDMHNRNNCGSSGLLAFNTDPNIYYYNLDKVFDELSFQKFKFTQKHQNEFKNHKKTNSCQQKRENLLKTDKNRFQIWTAFEIDIGKNEFPER